MLKNDSEANVCSVCCM